MRVLANRNIPVRLVVRQNSDIQQLDDFFQPERVIQTADLFAEQPAWWQEACKDVDTVIHCAWYAEPGRYLQSTRNLDCLAGTLDFAKGAAEAGVRRFIGIGTCFEYDLTGGALSIETPLKPLSLYAAAKASSYLMLSQFFALQRTAFCWCRLFYLYGTGEDPRRFVPYLHSCLSAGKPAELTSGNQIRDYLEINTAASMIVEAALSRVEGAVNICSGIPVTIRHFAEQIADEYGLRDLLQFGARPDNVVDPPCVTGIKTSLSTSG